jgi:hypothetical protein
VERKRTDVGHSNRRLEVAGGGEEGMTVDLKRVKAGKNEMQVQI